MRKRTNIASFSGNFPSKRGLALANQDLNEHFESVASVVYSTRPAMNPDREWARGDTTDRIVQATSAGNLALKRAIIAANSPTEEVVSLMSDLLTN